MHGASRAAQVALQYYESKRAAYLEETNQDDDLYAPGIPKGVLLDVGSRGFVYHSRKSAGEGGRHYHVHCHFRIVAGEKDTHVEGYKP